MSNFPAAIDSPSTLYSPVDAFSTKPLETTATVAIGSGDSTISVASTAGGFADAYGVLSINDELVIYTARSGVQFTGCQRGAFGTAAASHAIGATVRANMVAGFITAVQSAVVAIETELGTAAARNYVRKDGAVTITGVKTFQDGSAFGTGNIAGTGLVRLPNLGAIKWRKADNSGDLGMALNASNHVAMDAVIDFAAGQTFGAFSYPDATTTSKGIVQIDSVGGLVVAAGVVGLANTAVTPGTYPKVTVDQKGRVTAGASLVAGDVPAHTHVATDIVSGSLPFTIQSAGSAVGTRRSLNLIQGANVTLTVADDPGNDRVNVTVAAAGGATNHNLLSATHPDTVAAAPVPGDLIAATSTPAWARLAGQTTTTRKFLRQTGNGTISALPVWDTLVAGDIPAHNHAAGDVNSGTLALARGGAAADLSATGPGFLKQATTGAAVTVAALAAGDVPNLDTSKLTTGLLAVARGGTGATLAATGPGFLKQATSGAVVTVAAITESDVANLVTDLAGKAASVHTHISAQITDATAAATASTTVLPDGSAGANFGYVAANNLWAYLDSHLQSVECGAYQTVGGSFENMAKYSEDFTVGTWDKNGGSCSATANSTAAPDGSTTADTITAVTATPIIQQQVAGLASGGQYTFYVWGKVASGTKQVSIAIVDNAYAGYLAGPTSITLTTAWQRFKITGTLAGGQTGLWIVVRQFAGNGDSWTAGAVYLWGACLQQGNDPKNGYARTWASQTAFVAAGVACGATVIAAKDAGESPLRIYGPGSNLADHRLLEVTAGGELILAGGNGHSCPKQVLAV